MKKELKYVVQINDCPNCGRYEIKFKSKSLKLLNQSSQLSVSTDVHNCVTLQRFRRTVSKVLMQCKAKRGIIDQNYTLNMCLCLSMCVLAHLGGTREAGTS